MKLYSVTAISSLDEHNRDRCVAACTTLDRAKEIIENNECDIWEMDNDLAVIESFDSDVAYGVGPDHEKEQYWYQWNGPEGWDGVGAKGYKPIPVPEWFEKIRGFGVG